MSDMTQRVSSGVGLCLLCAATLSAPFATVSEAQSGWNPEIIRGTGRLRTSTQYLAYRRFMTGGRVIPPQ